ncbi:hypothetical protein [Leifsonia aquatica]|uniref:hypothetical protein n=1 Tax=Leifsonia aquatica TaxID=144185 RepID=UPI0038000A71
MPFKRVAEEMRDIYANAIARAVHDGDSPPGDIVASWAFYDAALREGRTAVVLQDRATASESTDGDGTAAVDR